MADGLFELTDTELDSVTARGTTTAIAGGAAAEATVKGERVVATTQASVNGPGFQVEVETTSEAEPSEEGVSLSTRTELRFVADPNGVSREPTNSGGTQGAANGGSPLMIRRLVGPRPAGSQIGAGDWSGPAICMSCR